MLWAHNEKLHYSLLMWKLSPNKRIPDGDSCFSFFAVVASVMFPIRYFKGQKQKMTSWQNMAHNIPQFVHMMTQALKNLLRRKGSAFPKVRRGIHAWSSKIKWKLFAVMCRGNYQKHSKLCYDDVNWTSKIHSGLWEFNFLFSSFCRLFAIWTGGDHWYKRSIYF